MGRNAQTPILVGETRRTEMCLVAELHGLCSNLSLPPHEQQMAQGRVMHSFGLNYRPAIDIVYLIICIK
jgi:hypothetical protein